MAEKNTRRRPMVNAATVERCTNIGFLGLFLNSTGDKRCNLVEHLGMTTQGFSRWFSVDDIRYSTLCRIYEHYGFRARMVFTYEDGKAPSRSTAMALMQNLDPAGRLNSLFVEMKLNNLNFEGLGKRVGRTPQAVNHWFLDDDIMVSMLRKAAQAINATVEIVPEKIEG